MNALTKTRTLVATATVLAGAAMPAWALKVANTVNGTVTAPVIGHEIKVDGVSYHVQSSNGTDNSLSSLKVGDHVELLLNAPQGSKGAAVTRVTPSNPAGR